MTEEASGGECFSLYTAGTGGEGNRAGRSSA
jgi:hypothetical protein